MNWRRWVVPVLAVLAVPVAVALALLAVDVLRAPGQVRADDVRFEGRPTASSGLWEDVGFLPGRVARRILGLDDDLAYRDMQWLVARIQPGAPASQLNPDLEGLRASTEGRLTEASRAEDDPVRRSQLLNLLAVVTMDRYTADPGSRAAILRSALGTLEGALDSNPGNADAKFNLELLLRDFYVAVAPGETPDRGAARGNRSGVGRSGSGY